jgi:hypothetical protein
MAARRAAPPAPPVLSDTDVETLRQRLQAGEAPRVVIRSASAAVPAGTRGTVVRLGDPASEDEYVVVRIKSDEVPFSPSELSLPGAKPVPAPAKSPAPSSAAPSRSGFSSATRRSKPAETLISAKGAAKGTKGRRRPPARKPAAPLTVTLRFDGSGWTAEAGRGARRLARPAPLRPGAVSALAEHVDDEALRIALVETVEACRTVVEEQAERLRAELRAAEAALRDYETRPRSRR